jgi:hypothetical protein
VSTSVDPDNTPLTPVVEDDNDNETLVGDNPDSPRSTTARDAYVKGNPSETSFANKSMVDINDDALFGRTWGFWEIIALKPVQNMLASLFLIS